MALLVQSTTNQKAIHEVLPFRQWDIPPINPAHECPKPTVTRGPLMRHSFINPKLQSRITEEYRRASLLASLPGGESMAMKAVIKAGTVEAYAAVNA